MASRTLLRTVCSWLRTAPHPQPSCWHCLAERGGGGGESTGRARPAPEALASNLEKEWHKASLTRPLSVPLRICQPTAGEAAAVPGKGPTQEQSSSNPSWPFQGPLHLQKGRCCTSAGKQLSLSLHSLHAGCRQQAGRKRLPDGACFTMLQPLVPAPDTSLLEPGRTIRTWGLTCPG